MSSYERYWRGCRVAGAAEEGADEIGHPNVDSASVAGMRKQYHERDHTEQEKEKQTTMTERQHVRQALADVKDNIFGARPKDPMLDTWKAERRHLRSQLTEKECDVKGEKDVTFEEDVITEVYSRTLLDCEAAKGVFHRSRTISTRRTSTQEQESSFLEGNEADIRHLSWLSKLEDIRSFLAKNPHLVCEEVANELTVYCINLAVSGKMALMRHVAKNVVLLVKMMRMARSLGVEPKDCVGAVVNRLLFAKVKDGKVGNKIRSASEEDKDSEDDEEAKRATSASSSSPLLASAISFALGVAEDTADFARKIEKRGEEEKKALKKAGITSLADAIKGKNGADVCQVLKQMPPSLRECFEKRDVTMLRSVVAGLSKKEARKWMKKCVDCGLWKPRRDDRRACSKTGLLLSDEEVEDNNGEARKTQYPE